MSTFHLHSITHVPYETVGTIGEWLRERGHAHTETALHAGEPLPASDEPDMLVVMGGPMSANDDRRYPWMSAERDFISRAIEGGKPVLGICLGAQLVASALGARVAANPLKEIGWHPIEMDARIFPRAHPHQMVFHWHGDTFDLPRGSERIASSAACTNQGFVYGDRVLGLQFHLEMSSSSIEALIANAGQELVPAPFVQSAEEIRAGGANGAENRALMFDLLDRFLAGTLFRP